MAYIQEKTKGKKIVSFKIKACLGRDAYGNSAQKIRIIYRDIGEWDYDDAAEAEQQQPQVVAITVTQPELLPA